MKSLEYHAEANRRSYQKHKAERLEKQKAYRQTEAGKATQARKDKKQQIVHSDHWYARQAVWRAIKAGKLTPPKYCERGVCENTKPQAHHYLGYAKEHRLDVEWLCQFHHVEAHCEVIGDIYSNPELLEASK